MTVVYRRHGRIAGVRLSPKPTAYGYACGEAWEAVTNSARDPAPRASVWREHGTYHVRGFDSSGARFWDSFATMAAAERAFRRIVRERLAPGVKP